MESIFVASDVHGSAFYAKALADAFVKSNADVFVLLGDVYNHGPRNPFPQDYAPMSVAETLNALVEKLIVVKGNCDSEVDEMISSFKFVKSKRLRLGKRNVFLTHGHVYNEFCLPKMQKGDVLCHGHTHESFVKKVGDVYVVNPGSVALPRDNFRGYALLTENGVKLCSLDGSFTDFSF